LRKIPQQYLRYSTLIVGSLGILLSCFFNWLSIFSKGYSLFEFGKFAGTWSEYDSLKMLRVVGFFYFLIPIFACLILTTLGSRKVSRSIAFVGGVYSTLLTSIILLPEIPFGLPKVNFSFGIYITFISSFIILVGSILSKEEFEPVSITAENTQNKNKKHISIGLTVIGACSLIGLIAFVFSAFTSSTNGASSPEAIIGKLSLAAKNGDMPSMVGIVDPNEIGPLVDNVSVFLKKAKKSGTIQNEKKPLDAYSIRFNNVKTQTIKYSDSVARVELISGTIDLDVDKSKLDKFGQDDTNSGSLNIEKVNQDYIKTAEAFSPDFNIADLESKHIFYIAVKHGDRWFASGLYTLAENARIYFNSTGEKIERPSFDARDRVGEGAKTSNLAVKNFLNGIIGLQTKEILNSTSPDRFSIGYDYKKTLLKLQDNKRDNKYLKIAQDGINISDIKTVTKSEGNNKKFNKIESVDFKIKYSLDVQKDDEGAFTLLPYSANISGKWIDNCLNYSGQKETYTKKIVKDETEYNFEDEAPYTDATGTVFVSSFKLSNAVYPITSSLGRIYPTDDSTYFDKYHSLPWTDLRGNTVYDAAGNKAVGSFGNYEADEQQNYPWKDSQGNLVYNQEGGQRYTPDSFVYEKNSNKVKGKNCFSNSDPKSSDNFGIITIKEKDIYYVSPIDTIWHYAIQYLKDN
jgi:hypothetical protein